MYKIKKSGQAKAVRVFKTMAEAKKHFALLVRKFEKNNPTLMHPYWIE